MNFTQRLQVAVVATIIWMVGTALLVTQTIYLPQIEEPPFDANSTLRFAATGAAFLMPVFFLLPLFWWVGSSKHGGIRRLVAATGYTVAVCAMEFALIAGIVAVLEFG